MNMTKEALPLGTPRDAPGIGQNHLRSRVLRHAFESVVITHISPEVQSELG